MEEYDVGEESDEEEELGSAQLLRRDIKKKLQKFGHMSKLDVPYYPTKTWAINVVIVWLTPFSGVLEHLIVLPLLIKRK